MPVPQVTPSAAATDVEPFVHVADVERSLAFYALLGCARRGDVKSPSGRTNWASAACGRGGIMFAQADGPVDPRQQAVLFYMWTKDLAGLRAHLLASGVRDGGTLQACHGSPDTDVVRSVAFEITFPFYMPGGEMRVHDPDGYVILIGKI